MNINTQQLKPLSLSIIIALAAGCSTDSAEHRADRQDSSTPPAEVLVDESFQSEHSDFPEAGRVEHDHSIAMPEAEPVPAPPPVSMNHQLQEAKTSAGVAYRPDALLVKRQQPAPGTFDPAYPPVTEPYTENYERPDDFQTVRVIDSPVSTFSIDVDTGAYSNMRRWLNQGQLPPENAVRVEEFVNYFDYSYQRPPTTEVPFLAETEIAPTPWNAQTHLLRIGIQGYEVPESALPASNLVFLLDVSGSMNSPNKLPLLKQAMAMLVRKLDSRDTVSIVVYAGASGVVLDSVAGDQEASILAAMNQLQAGGSTNGEAGIQMAYQLARQNFKKNGVNRVILATDGDFNVGVASTDELIDLVERQRKSGIALTTLGFGAGNYNDHLMEQLADAGNGNHAYIDQLNEARKVLSQEMSSTLLTIASDVKIQVEFNPRTVAEYRLIGYENRALNEEDFNNDQVDAGEIGAGHTVTALYEITLVGSDFRRLPARRYQEDDPATTSPDAHADELAYLRIRYKNPGEDQSQLIESPVGLSAVRDSVTSGSSDFRFAAAVSAFGQKLRGGEYLQEFGYQEIRELAAKARGDDEFGYRGEFLQLVSLAESLDVHSSDSEPLAMEGR